MDNDENTLNSTSRVDNHRLRMAVTLGLCNISYAIFDPLATSDTERLKMVSVQLPHSPLDDFPDVTTLEEAVYAHPSMLADYGRVDVVIDTREFLLTPIGLSQSDVDAMANVALSGVSTAKVVVETPDTINDATLWMRIPAVLDAFLRRTFNTPRYHHPLSITARCYSVDTVASSPVVNLHFTATYGLIIIVRRDNRLLLANQFEVHSDTDVVYYTLAVLEAIGLTPADVRIRTSGQQERRQSAALLLNRSFDDVAPASLPSPLLREGSVAMSLPIELSSLLLL